MDKTPAHLRLRRRPGGAAWCFERSFEGQEQRQPVRLVVFDWDETLTLSTFLPGDQGLRSRIGWCDWAEYITEYNFETPWVNTPGRTRVEKLRALFADLRSSSSAAASKVGTGGCEQRTLAILTRNNQGCVACLNLLMMAELQDYFDAIWCMASVPGIPSGVFRSHSGEWFPFEPPFREVFDHKADVLHALCREPARWFPQLSPGGGEVPPAAATPAAASTARPLSLAGLRPEQIVLVDDVRTNFQSSGPDALKVPRYCKVARYDCVYRDMGFKSDMGGLGARSDEDYEVLANFVREPWRFKAAPKLQCIERPFAGIEARPRVDLVVFDFDETLTLYTCAPDERESRSSIGFCASTAWRRQYVEYNFQTPYVQGDRVKKLGAMLEAIALGRGPLDDADEDDGDEEAGDADGVGGGRSLAILTHSEDGAILVLNLLHLAGLDSHFAAIWTLGAEDGHPNGVYRAGEDDWHSFALPIDRQAAADESLPLSKCEVLRSVVRDPKAWFPQLAAEGGATAAEQTAERRRLLGLRSLASVVLVDDESANFRSRGATGSSAAGGDGGAREADGGAGSPEGEIVRLCEVTRYDDDNFRDQGLITHMGGIGAKSDEDYGELLAFIRRPWLFAAPAAPGDLGGGGGERFGGARGSSTGTAAAAASGASGGASAAVSATAAPSASVKAEDATPPERQQEEVEQAREEQQRRRAATDIGAQPQVLLERRHTKEELDSEYCSPSERRRHRALTLPA